MCFCVLLGVALAGKEWSLLNWLRRGKKSNFLYSFVYSCTVIPNLLILIEEKSAMPSLVKQCNRVEQVETILSRKKTLIEVVQIAF